MFSVKYGIYEFYEWDFSSPKVKRGGGVFSIPVLLLYIYSELFPYIYIMEIKTMVMMLTNDKMCTAVVQ